MSARPDVRRRRPRAPLHGRARRRDRGPLAGPLGRRRHLRGPNPAGPLADAGRRRPAGRSSSCSTCSRTRRGAGLHVGHPLGLHRHRRLRPLQAHDRPQRAAHDGLRRLRPARRAVRRRRPASTRAITTEANIANYRRQLRRLGLGHDPRRRIATTDVGLLPLDAVDLPADLQRLVRHRRRPGPPDRRAGRRVRVAAPAPRPTAAPWADARRRSSGAQVVDDAPPGLPRRGAGELVPRPGHGAGQRGGHRRRPQRPRQLPRLQAQPAAVDDADHRLRRPPDRRPRPARLARADQAMQRNWIGRSPRARSIDFPRRPTASAITRVHHPARHAVRRDVHGAGARAPAGRRARPRAWPDDTPADVDRRRSHARRRGRGLPPPGGAASDVERQDESRAEDRRVHRRLRDQPGRPASRSRSSSPTTC